MHFLCKCGFRLHDSSDKIYYKGRVIADQDWNKFWEYIEKLEKPYGGDTREIYNSIHDLFGMNMYQCLS
ncbi:MAG: hypothetical protein IKQ90_08650 [Ruminococcus sp.]|nr:hypothetical protein [Ruminococcus sp.]